MSLRGRRYIAANLKNVFDLHFDLHLQGVYATKYISKRKLYYSEAGVQHLTDIFLSESKLPIMET